MTESDFRLAYPEFNDPGFFTSSAIVGLLATASLRLDADSWQDSLTQGVGLFVAHYLILSAKQLTSNGSPQAVITSKTVGPITIAYDPNWTAIKNGGHWNLTGYGQQFIYLARLVGNCVKGQFYGC